MNHLTFGADPEVFATINNMAVSPALLKKYGVIEKIGGDTKHPIFFRQDGEFSWMMDGVAFETTLLVPHHSAESLHRALKNSIIFLEERLNNLSLKDQKISVFKKPAVKIDPAMYLNQLDDPEIYQGFIFGCDKDWDAIETLYEGETFEVFTHKWRYGGGHFHVGSEDADVIESMHNLIVPLIQLMAIFVGNVSIANSKFPKEEKKRVFHYGNPGRYRPQKWGIEFRSPSNSWIEDLKTTEEMCDGAYLAMYYLENQNKGVEILKHFLPPTIKAITTCDQNLAREILMDAKK